MSKFRDILSTEQRSEYLLTRISQLAQSGYQLELDAKSLSEFSDEASLEQIKQQISIIEKAITVHKAELEEK